ncbi:MAG: TonB-dependent receptor plug domain-containing protein [Alphaproteobacteria bacterium]|nr:TonB-dependent receptor plug domain-containing protein [Alphaproteobacteria bacterium]
MTRGLVLLALPACLLPGLLAGPRARAQEVEQVTVTGDAVHLLDVGANSAAFGLNKPLIETPRAVTLVSDTTIARYGISGIDDLTAITPSAYTASYYGVEGAVSLRGTLAENYFRGFKRAENRGTYSTPLADAAGIEILRGPPSPIYGPGKVGGLVNFLPKTANGTDTLGGEVTASYGSYSKRNLTGQLSAPVTLGDFAGGVHAYGELDDSYSYYRGLHPSHQLVELSANLADDGWSLAADYLYYHSNGDIQTPGWNRLTQPLIDRGTYITGRNTSVVDTDGNGRLTPNELGGNPYAYDPGFTPLACMSCVDAAHRLDSGYGGTWLDRRSVYVARGVDFSNTVTHTGFLEVARDLDDGQSLRLQLFADTLSNDRFVSYGFPGSYRTSIGEARLRYDVRRDIGAVKTQTVAGLSYRHVHARGRESYNSGVIALDRRDISVGPAANDIIDSPFNIDPPGTVGLGWENDVTTSTGDAGAFITTDASWKGFDLVLGGRYDNYHVRSTERGVLAYAPPSGRGNAGRFGWSASLSYDAPFGLVPYVTIAQSSALEIGQASQVSTSLLASKAWLSDSFLDEVGVKFAALDDHLQGSLDWYVQNRTRLSQGGGVVNVEGTRARGAEIELRYVANDNLSLTLAASVQRTTIKGPNHSFAYIPARAAGVSPEDGFGGSYLVYDLSTLPGLSGSYEDSAMPHAVISPYVTWTGDPLGDVEWGATFGGTYVSATHQTIADPIRFPSYVTLNVSGFVRQGAWEVDMNVNNLGNERYFTPGADTYSMLSALPGPGRLWKMTLKRLF